MWLIGLASCTAEPSCVDTAGRPCAKNEDCAPDVCRQVVGEGAGFFCAPPDGSNIRIVNASLSAAPQAEGKTEAPSNPSVSLRNGRFRSMPTAEGRTSTFTLVEGDMR